MSRLAQNLASYGLRLDALRDYGPGNTRNENKSLNAVSVETKEKHSFPRCRELESLK